MCLVQQAFSQDLETRKTALSVSHHSPNKVLAASKISFQNTSFDTNKFLLASLSSSNTNFAPVLSPTTLPNPIIGASYSQTITASGGVAPYTFAVTSGSLPAGLTLDPAGGLTGMPTVAGTFNFTVTATDSINDTGSQPYSFTISPPTITVNPTTLPNPTAGTAYSQLISASGGTAPYTYAVTSGSLPAGLTMDPFGTLFGTPTVAGTFNFTITATDDNNFTGDRAYTINVAPPTITLNPSTLTNPTFNVAYFQTVSANGGTAPYTYAITSGSLPAGLTLDPSGNIFGTATSGGTSNFTITATDTNGFTGTQPYSVTIIGGPTITVSPPTLPNPAYGVSYSQIVSASGGTSPYTYTVTSGSLPAGLSLSAATGVISGTATSVGTFNFTVTATDSDGFTGNQPYTFVIATPTINVNPSTLPNPTYDVNYSQSVSASGGIAPYSYAVTSGSLPNGLSLNSSTGAITGTPTSSGTFNFTITATDANSFTGDQPYSLVIAVPTITITPPTLPDPTYGVNYSQVISASGGAGTYTYSVTSGGLPTGLSLSTTTGVISGIPTSSGTFNFTITATDSNGFTGNQPYTFIIAAPPTITINPPTLPNPTFGVNYSQLVSASGGTAPYLYSVTSGSLPLGLSLNSATGAITGTPTSAGTFNFTITATDANDFTGNQPYSVTIIGPTITVNPPTLPNPSLGEGYSQIINASGGTTPYIYSLTSGNLPNGLSLNSFTGVLDGVPSASGTFNFTITATDANGFTGQQTYSLTVASTATITLTPTVLPNPTLGLSYSQAITASGGTMPYTFIISSGALPPGLNLTDSGTITGTVTAGGSYNFTITATDSSGLTQNQTYQLRVVVVRPDPTNDAGVKGVVSTQALTTQFLTNSVISTITDHFQKLHQHFAPLSNSVHIGFQNPFSMQYQQQQLWATKIKTMSASPQQQYTSGYAPNQENADIFSMSNLDLLTDKLSLNNLFLFNHPLSIWATGNLAYGQFAIPSPITNHFNIESIMSGFDWQLKKTLIVGAGLGYGNNKNDTTNPNYTSPFYVLAHQTTGSIYASYQPLKDLFIDALLGFGTSSFNNDRNSQFARISSQRDGQVTFGSLGISKQIVIHSISAQPFTRGDIVQGRLEQFNESNTDFGLTYAPLNFSTISWDSGLMISTTVIYDTWHLTPMLKTEYIYTSGNSNNQTFFYTDLGANAAHYAMPISNFIKNIGSASIWLNIQKNKGINIALGATGALGSNSYEMHSIQLNLNYPFN